MVFAAALRLCSERWKSAPVESSMIAENCAITFTSACFVAAMTLRRKLVPRRLSSATAVAAGQALL